MLRRKRLLEVLSKNINEQRFENCAELCFEILYRLFPELQAELSLFMMRRYLAIFETRYPETGWPREILDDPEKLASKFGYDIPEDADLINNLADSAFIFCFYALIHAYYHQNNTAVLTTSCVCAIYSAIGARRDNTWMADDPKSVGKWERGEYPIPTASENVAAVAVEAREWNEVAKWLREKKVWTYSDDVDNREMLKVLDYWKESEMTLIGCSDEGLSRLEAIIGKKFHNMPDSLI